MEGFSGLLTAIIWWDYNFKNGNFVYLQELMAKTAACPFTLEELVWLDMNEPELAKKYFRRHWTELRHQFIHRVKQGQFGDNRDVGGFDTKTIQNRL